MKFLFVLSDKYIIYCCCQIELNPYISHALSIRYWNDLPADEVLNSQSETPPSHTGKAFNTLQSNNTMDHVPWFHTS